MTGMLFLVKRGLRDARVAEERDICVRTVLSKVPELMVVVVVMMQRVVVLRVSGMWPRPLRLEPMGREMMERCHRRRGLPQRRHRDRLQRVRQSTQRKVGLVHQLRLRRHQGHGRLYKECGSGAEDDDGAACQHPSEPLDEDA